MADQSNEEQPKVTSSSSWWGSWIDTAKSKSASVLEAVKNDLTELSTVVKSEASNASAAFERSLSLNEPDSTVGAMKKSFSSFLGQVTEALIPSLEEDEDTEAVLITNDGTVTLTGFYKHLAELQANDTTYLDEPNDELSEKYKRWMEVVEQEQFTENRLAKHLTSSQILNEKYLNLVPDKIVHMEFWKRYLFKKALLEDAIANAEMAERKAKSEIASTQTISPQKIFVQTEQPKKVCDEGDVVVDEEEDDEEINWGKVPDFDASNIDLSEEEQARLLEEYEQEIKEREKNITKIETAIEQSVVAPKISGAAAAKPKSPKKVIPAVTVSPKKNQPIVNNKANTKKTLTAVTTTKPATPQQKSAKNVKSSNSKNEELKIEKNHFTKDEVSSSNSDESWEKEFDLDETQ